MRIHALLTADKTLLRAGVTALGLTGEVLEIVSKAIDAHKISNDSFGLTIDKSHTLGAILEACQKWRLITRQRHNGDLISDKLKIISNVHSPSYDKPEIAWKQRGDHWEKTRNLIVHIDGVASNVHVHTGGTWKAKQPPRQ